MRKLLLFALVLFLFTFISAQVVTENRFSGNRGGTASYINYGSSFTSYYGAEASTYWPVLSNRDECTNSQDIIVQVSPVGCQPAVVRSDLLAEQNVPVFCQLDLLQINPAIDIKQIRNLRFSGRYPPEVAGVGFHPARAALRTTNQLLGSPLESNIGYVVVVLKRNINETSMPKFFNFTLSASVDYYSGNSVGIGVSEMLLQETADKDWELAKRKQTFFGGKFSVRVKDVDTNSIGVELYSGDLKYSELTLRKNQPQSNSVYLPGSYCQTSLQLSYSDFVSPPVIARLKVDNDVLDLYEGSRFLNNKCLVRKVSGSSTKGEVDISCGKETLNLRTGAQLLKVGDKVYMVGGDLKVIKDKEYSIDKVINDLKTGKLSYEIKSGETNAKSEPVDFDKVRLVSQAKLFDSDYGENEQYILNATEYYELLADSYGNEKNGPLAESYGETALSRAIRLSNDWGKKNNAVRLINKYLDLYPNGKDSVEFTGILNDIYTVDSSLAGQGVETEDGFHLIRLIDITNSGKKSSAKISWGNEEEVVNQGGTFETSLGKLGLVSVIDSEKIKVNIICKSANAGKDYEINSRDTTKISDCGGPIRVSNIDWQNFVKLTISPITRSSTVGNFTVGIGIEKRAIELTPEKAKKKIENLNKTIKKWESISNSLGNVVRGLKGACFATAGVLIVKNFVTGLGGESLARRDAMSGDNGWTKICQDEVNNKKEGSLTLTQCYNTHSEDIKKSVDARVKAIKKTGEVTSEIENRAGIKNPSREGIFAGDSFNDVEARKALIDKIKRDCGTKTFTIGIEQRTVDSLLPTASTITDENAKQYSYSQLRDIYYNCQIIDNKGSSQGTKKAETDLSVIGKSVDERLRYEKDVTQYNGIGLYTLDVGVKGTYSGETAKTLRNKGFDIPLGIGNDVFVQVVRGRDKPYLITLDKNTAGYQRKDIYSLDDKTVGSKLNILTSTLPSGGQTDLTGLPSTFDLVNSGSYYNSFAPGESTVRYFETEPYKGTPAVVPFDLNRGFYAATTQSLPILGKTKSYESNGRPASFYVCNIMTDKRVGFYSPNYGDDECVKFDIYTGQPFDSFPGLTESDTKKLVSDAVKALEEAAQQYGKKVVRIRGNTLNVGQAAALLPGSQCQDFMSPQDCKLLFNVCDPVICPSSRCNFGGSYYVSDVIQSGIVGSALLCLPNVKEGIVMPVCLTGLKAGIDGYLSILKSHQQCLQEAIDTGKYVGICDQISSVYMCEFFWRQAAPIARMALPKLIEYAYTGGQGNVRGGGEYMTVQNSWQNMEDSASYFTQSYAANSFEAFKIRNVEEAGTEICRAFISAKGPKTFESLIEPDSPAQFHAWYSAIDFTDATIPATSQYKVFYHIFAGNDRGVSYSVYLKDPPADTMYSSNPIMVVATGFAARGQYATESKDFTAPKGYQQLCVRINDREECGFKQVSSSFAVDYVKDSVVADQLKQTDVTTESECISGSVSPAALLNPNLGSVAEEALNPAIYNRGIVRICATSNPGSATDPTRFVKVGVCGESRLGCWLDKQSVDKSITAGNVGLRNQTLSEIKTIQENNLKGDSNFKSSDDISKGLAPIIDKVNGGVKENLVAVLKSLDDLMLKAFWNYDKAEILLWKAVAYHKVFEKEANEANAPNVASGGAGATNSAGSTGNKDNIKKIERKLILAPNKGEIYIFFNDEPTKFFIKGGNIYSSIAGEYGKINDRKLDFGNTQVIIDEVNKAFGSGSYDLIDNKITVDQLTKGIDLNDIDKSSASNVQNAGKILKLEPEKDKSGERYFRFDNRITSIYLDIGDNTIRKSVFGKDTYLGDFKDNKIIFADRWFTNVKNIIVEEFKDDAYDKLNGKSYTLRNLEDGIDLGAEKSGAFLTATGQPG